MKVNNRKDFDKAVSLEPGMVIMIPAEVKHWHSAKAPAPMELPQMQEGQKKP